MMRYFCVLIFFIFSSVLLVAQDNVLLTNGKEIKAKILYKDNNWIYLGLKPKKIVSEQKRNEAEKKYNDKKQESDKYYAELLTTLANNADETKLNKLKIKQAASKELLRKKEVDALAKTKFNSLKRISVERVFSVTTADGQEEIIYSPDTLGFLVLDVVEPELDLSIEEMRRYIIGRQDGMKVKKTAALLTSAGISFVGSGLGAFFGPIAPATYIIVLGTTKQKPKDNLVDHPEYIFDENYLEGYKKSARKRKIIAAAEGGLIGLGLGITTYWAVFRGF